MMSSSHGQVERESVIMMQARPLNEEYKYDDYLALSPHLSKSVLRETLRIHLQ